MVGELLGLVEVVDIDKSVVGLDEADALLVELAGEPFVAIDLDLGGERKHGLDADIHQTEVGIEEIEVEDALRPGSKRQTRPLVAMQKFDGAAMFFATQDGDQAVVMGLIA